MKLDRNINSDGMGKYALLKLRELDQLVPGEVSGDLPAPLPAAFAILRENGVLDWGERGTDREFFLIRLKDKYAQVALRAYADAARVDDPQYAAEIDEMAARSGPDSPWCKRPD